MNSALPNSSIGDAPIVVHQNLWRKPVIKRNKPNFLQWALCGSLAIGATFVGAGADAATVLYSSGLVSVHNVNGSSPEASDFSFTTPGPGELDVQLTNLPLPTMASLLTGLDFTLSSSTGALGSIVWSGPLISESAVFAVSGSQQMSALVDAQAGQNGGIFSGAYDMVVSFTPAVAPVPLPSGLVLMLSSLGLLGSAVGLLQRPRHGSVMYGA